MDLNKICPHCGTAIPQVSFFCPICGKKILEKPLGIGKEVYYYLMSLAIPPLGYWYWYKFHNSIDSRAKRVAYVSAILTTISLVVTIWFTKAMLDTVSSAVGKTSLHQDYSSLGL